MDLVCFLQNFFWTSITATNNIFYLVGFLAPWFLTKISPKKVNHKNARIFLPYVPPSLSSAAYLPLPLPTTTCHCLQLPAKVYHYLFLSDHHLLPLLAITCKYLPIPRPIRSDCIG